MLIISMTPFTLSDAIDADFHILRHALLLPFSSAAAFILSSLFISSMLSPLFSLMLLLLRLFSLLISLFHTLSLFFMSVTIFFCFDAAAPMPLLLIPRQIAFRLMPPIFRQRLIFIFHFLLRPLFWCFIFVIFDVIAAFAFDADIAITPIICRYFTLMFRCCRWFSFHFRRRRWLFACYAAFFSIFYYYVVDFHYFDVFHFRRLSFSFHATFTLISFAIRLHCLFSYFFFLFYIVLFNIFAISPFHYHWFIMPPSLFHLFIYAFIFFSFTLSLIDYYFFSYLRHFDIDMLLITDAIDYLLMPMPPLTLIAIAIRQYFLFLYYLLSLFISTIMLPSSFDAFILMLFFDAIIYIIFASLLLITLLMTFQISVISPLASFISFLHDAPSFCHFHCRHYYHFIDAIIFIFRFSQSFFISLMPAIFFRWILFHTIDAISFSPDYADAAPSFAFHYFRRHFSLPYFHYHFAIFRCCFIHAFRADVISPLSAIFAFAWYAASAIFAIALILIFFIIFTLLRCHYWDWCFHFFMLPLSLMPYYFIIYISFHTLMLFAMLFFALRVSLFHFYFVYLYAMFHYLPFFLIDLFCFFFLSMPSLFADALYYFIDAAAIYFIIFFMLMLMMLPCFFRCHFIIDYYIFIDFHCFHWCWHFRCHSYWLSLMPAFSSWYVSPLFHAFRRYATILYHFFIRCAAIIIFVAITFQPLPAGWAHYHYYYINISHINNIIGFLAFIIYHHLIFLLHYAIGHYFVIIDWFSRNCFAAISSILLAAIITLLSFRPLISLITPHHYFHYFSLIFIIIFIIGCLLLMPCHYFRHMFHFYYYFFRLLRFFIFYFISSLSHYFADATLSLLLLFSSLLRFLSSHYFLIFLFDWLFSPLSLLFSFSLLLFDIYFHYSLPHYASHITLLILISLPLRISLLFHLLPR